ncbi:hypothetical protein QCN29_21425 [Streptomyces sp. HNM0663]|uniref:Excreted virulence factor EspC (Type VII ESX diderm) n=1 Tax=Streptomyces chengmaiensis TaxID=3040919 RepID=A0ABT6HRG6_9ACTN|nr:hypothetical protein [Streptomyces chengmaiensis]MDH2391296.1 hypothetical protein [Streptomyces chengmaiensis]
MGTPLGGTGGFWIEADDVQKAGAAARKVAQDIPADIKTLYKPTDNAVKGLPGWRTAKALDECVDAWAKALRSLAGLVDGAGDAVSASGKASRNEDDERRRAFQGLPPYTYGAGMPR